MPVEAADLAGIEPVDRAAEAEDGAEGLALLHLGLQRGHAMRLELAADVLQRAWPDGGAGAGEEHGMRDPPGEGLLLLADQPDRLGGFRRVELAALGGDDDQVGPADGVGDGQAGGAFQVDEDEGNAGGGGLDRVDHRLLGDVGDDLEPLGPAGAAGPGGDGAVGVGIDDGDGGAAAGELAGQDDGGGGFAGAPLGAGEDDGGHRDGSPGDRCGSDSRKLPGRKRIATIYPKKAFG